MFFLPGAFEPVDLSYRDPGVPEISEINDWLAAQEAEVPQLRDNAHKRVVWAGEPGAKTPLSVIYVHGFSASSEELRPVPDALAEALGANLHFTRLSGHGRDSAAMAQFTVRDLADDLAQALAVGRTIGERVIVVGTSMGGALSSLAALDPEYGTDIAGLALFAPAFRIPAPGRQFMAMPYVRHWGPYVMGKTRSFIPANDAQAAAWTYSYPLVS
ncbi:MAG: alpha/beta fold hydrolase, partial [Pseudomonadota bacterium]